MRPRVSASLMARDLFERARSRRWISMKCANRSSRCAPTYFNAKRQNAIDTCQSSNETNRSVHVFLSFLSPRKLPFDGVQSFNVVYRFYIARARCIFSGCPSRIQISNEIRNNTHSRFSLMYVQLSVSVTRGKSRIRVYVTSLPSSVRFVEHRARQNILEIYAPLVESKTELAPKL